MLILKCMGIMQADLRHPYILSTTVLSDRKNALVSSILIFILCYRVR